MDSERQSIESESRDERRDETVVVYEPRKTKNSQKHSYELAAIGGFPFESAWWKTPQQDSPSQHRSQAVQEGHLATTASP